MNRHARPRRPLPSARLVLWWLVLALFVLKALVPQGFMPNPSASRTALLTLCSANGPVYWAVSLPASRPDAPIHEHPAHAACPFAVAGILGPPNASAQAVQGGLRMNHVQPAHRLSARYIAAPQSAPLGARAPPGLV